MKNQQEINSSQTGREAIEIPLPEDHYRKLGIASRPTFYRWEKQGLRVLRVNNRRFIYPRDLIGFLESVDAAGKKNAANSIPKRFRNGEEESK